MVDRFGDENSEGTVVIGAGVDIKGEMTVPGLVTIDGRFEGTLKAKCLLVGRTGHAGGQISAQTVEVRGTVGENLVAETQLVVRSSGAICGSVSYGKIIVEEGGELSGTIQKIVPAAPEHKVVPLQRGE